MRPKSRASSKERRNRRKLPNALPVIVTHGWPGSIIEQLKIIDPLTNPTAHGGSASDAFDVALRSPENYVGYDRTQNFASPRGADRDRRRVYSAPARLALNQWALVGEWTMGRQATVLNKASGEIVYRFQARDVHLVMGPSRPGGSVRFRVTIDRQTPGAAHGLDVDESGNGTAAEQRLYQLIRQPKPIVDRTFVIGFLDAGVETFAFTFG